MDKFSSLIGFTKAVEQGDFAAAARAILNDLAAAEAAVRDDHDEPRGELKINAPMSFGTMHLTPAPGCHSHRSCKNSSRG